MNFRCLSSSTRAISNRKIGRSNITNARDCGYIGAWTTVGCSPVAHQSQHQHTTRKVSRSTFSSACAALRPGPLQCGLTSDRGWEFEVRHRFSGTGTSRVVGNLNLRLTVNQAHYSSHRTAATATVRGSKRCGFSSSSDASSTGPQKTGDEKKIVVGTVEDADTPGNESGDSRDATVPKEPRHSHVLMPNITDVRFAFDDVCLLPRVCVTLQEVRCALFAARCHRLRSIPFRVQFI